MSICYFENFDDNNFKKKYNYRIIEPTIIDCNINISKINKIMVKILSKYCNGTIIGYSKNESCYFLKKIHKSICKLYINIKVKAYDLNNSYLIINPTIGRDNDINFFITRFCQIIKLYDESPFFRDSLEIM